MGWGLFAEPAGIVLLAAAWLAAIGWFVSAAGARKAQARQNAELQERDRQIHELSAQITAFKVAEAGLNSRIQSAGIRIDEVREELQQSKSANQLLACELSDARSAITGLETRLTEERKAAVEKLLLLDEAKQKLGNEFRLLANQIFEERGRAFSEQNRTGIDEILKPMREQLSEFRKRVDDVHLNDSRDRASLKEHLAQLEKLNRQMSEDAVGLTQALKGESKAQGNWGEMILERILETSGLREGHEFLREDSSDIGGGRRLRPDVIVRMPGEKHIIIDSKVSLTDYERAAGLTDGTDRVRFIKAHVNSMKSHIKGLADKHYAQLPGINSPDYVLMFMPIEGAYMLAIEEDQAIFESAFDKGVAVVTPSTLYATLKLVEQLWRYERQSENVLKLIDRAGRLHDKMASFVESFEEIGSRIDQAKNAYDTSLNRIRSGPGNVISQIAMLGKLAGKTQKELPKHLSETAIIDDAADAGGDA